MKTTSVDIAIIGAGIAGASLAWALGGRASAVLLEREAQPGYHTTGRSAAFFADNYGGPDVVPLSLASKSFFLAPPGDFVDVPLARQRGGILIAREGEQDRIDALLATPAGRALQRCTQAELLTLVPALRPAYVSEGAYDPGCLDLDVAALHAGYLRAARRSGVGLMTDADVLGLERHGSGWIIHLADGREIKASILVNAAGAWADAIAERAGAQPLAIIPKRRTIITFVPEPALYHANQPIVQDMAETFYFKPEAGQIWASPADETPSPACDAQPDELDIAITIDRLQQATLFEVGRLGRCWAGLRSFAPDRAPVYGFDPQVAGFFWCAGQGGFGIQTSPAAGQLAASLLLQAPLPEPLSLKDVDPARYAPGRFKSFS